MTPPQRSWHARTPISDPAKHKDWYRKDARRSVIMNQWRIDLDSNKCPYIIRRRLDDNNNKVSQMIYNTLLFIMYTIPNSMTLGGFVFCTKQQSNNIILSWIHIHTYIISYSNLGYAICIVWWIIINDGTPTTQYRHSI